MRERIPKATVIGWLEANHPTLLPSVEEDRAWVWVTADLRSNAETRKSLSEYGFVFSGRHRLPSGKIGTWGHSCDAPIPFKRRRRPDQPATTTYRPRPERNAKPPVKAEAPLNKRVDPLGAQPTASLSEVDMEALAFLAKLK